MSLCLALKVGRKSLQWGEIWSRVRARFLWASHTHQFLRCCTHFIHASSPLRKEISFFTVETLKALKRGKFSFSGAACKCCREESLLCTWDEWEELKVRAGGGISSCSFFQKLFICFFMFGCAGSLMLPANFLQLRGAGLTLGVGLLLWGKGSRGGPSGCSTHAGLSCPSASSPDQGSNVCVGHWQENSLPPSCQRSPDA